MSKPDVVSVLIVERIFLGIRETPGVFAAQSGEISSYFAAREASKDSATRTCAVNGRCAGMGAIVVCGFDIVDRMPGLSRPKARCVPGSAPAAARRLL